MENKSDPINVLLKLNKTIGSNIDEKLIKDCYKIQKDHQYDKDRNTVNKIQAIVESYLIDQQGNNLI